MRPQLLGQLEHPVARGCGITSCGSDGMRLYVGHSLALAKLSGSLYPRVVGPKVGGGIGCLAGREYRTSRCRLSQCRRYCSSTSLLLQSFHCHHRFSWRYGLHISPYCRRMDGLVQQNEHSLASLLCIQLSMPHTNRRTSTASAMRSAKSLTATVTPWSILAWT